jgi:hypothetical protein
MSPDFYRKEAARLRRLASDQTDPDLAAKLRQLADENDALAVALEANDNKQS